MKNIGMKTLGILAGAVCYSHALFGIGGQWAPALGLEVKGDSSAVVGTGANAIYLSQAKVEGLNGLGLKVWIDSLPFVDIEAGSNLQFGFYDLTVVQGTNKVEVKAPLDVPMVDEKPGFARIASDLSVLYPFLKLPPVIPVAKVYAGAGITHVLATEVLNASLAKKAVDKAVAAGRTPDTPAEVAQELVNVLKDEGLSSGVGFHLMAGVKVKPPIIPIAAFANIKYHFLGSMPDAVDGNSLTMELGGALAF
jgi:hypothetical protein